MPKQTVEICCDQDCPVRKAMDILAGKWTLLIVRDLLGGKRRFGELNSSIGGVSPKVLAQRLKLLETEGLITKVVYPEVPPRVEYELTEKGRRLRQVIDALAAWGATL